jgi:hypothetical protein
MTIDAFIIRWNRIENKALYAWRTLDAHLRLDTTLFDDWLYSHLGEDGLVELARQYVPQYEPSQQFTYSQVSRAYNLPVKDAAGLMGIGNPDAALLKIMKRYNAEAAPIWEPLRN